MRIADLLDSINAQSSVRVSERDVRLALNELVSSASVSPVAVPYMCLAQCGCAACLRCGVCLACLPAWASASQVLTWCLDVLPPPLLQEDMARVQQGVVLLRA
jgi:hypothetical protein